MSARCQVVLDVRGQRAAQSALVHNDDVIEALAGEWIRSSAPRSRSATVTVEP